MPGDSDAIKVFISYSRDDGAIADGLVAALESKGFSVRIDRRDLPYGEEWQRELAAFILAADTVVWLVSPGSLSSRWCRWELGEVSRLNKRLIPVRIREFSLADLPETLGKLHILPAEGVYQPELHVGALVNALETDRAWIMQHTRLTDRAREWMHGGRRRDLLLRGAQLKAAEAWADARPPSAPEPGAELLALVLESRRAATRRQRTWLAGSLASAVITATLALFAWFNGVEARRQQLIATARALASMATQEQGETRQDERAALLARQAFLLDARAGGGSQSSIAAALQRVMSAAWFNAQFEASIRAVSQDFAWAVLQENERLLLARAQVDFGRAPSFEVLPLDLTGALQCKFSPRSDVIVCLDKKGVSIHGYGTNPAAAAARIRTPAEPTMLAIAGDARSMLVGLSDRTLMHIELPVANSRQISDSSPRKLAADLSSIALDARGGLAAAAYDNGDVRVFRLDDNKTVGEVHLGQDHAKALAFEPDDDRLAIGGHYGKAWLWRWTKGDGGLVRLGETDGSVDSVVFSPDGTELATASGSTASGVFFWAAGPRPGRIGRLPGPRGVSFIAYRHDNARVMAASLSAEVHLIRRLPWEHAPRAIDLFQYQKTLYRPMVFSMALRPDDKGAVLAGGHGLLQYFENVAKTTVPIVLAEQRKAAIRRRPARDALVQDGYDWLQHGHILSADFSPDGRFFATGDIYGNIHHWAVAGIGGEPVIVDQSGKAKVWSLAYSSNGRVLAAGYEGEIRFYALGDGSMRRVAQFTLPEKSGVIRRIVAGRDPDVFFAAVDEHGVIRLQLKDTTVRNETLLESGDHVWALARSGVSEDMLAASSGSTLWLLTPSATVDGGWEKRALSSGVGFVASAAWSADGRVLAAGFDDGSIRLWRSERLDDLPVTVRTEGGYVRAIALSSNGAFLVAGGDDAHLRYFPLDVRAAAESVCGTVMRNLTRSEWKDFVGEALAYEATCPGIPGSVPVD